MISVLLLIGIAFIAFKVAPREKKGSQLVHGAGQIALLASVALFGMDYFTSFFYAAGELMGALHPYGLQQYGYLAAGVVAFGNIVFGALYMYSLGIFNEGGGAYTASMRYLVPSLSLIVAVTLIQDYLFTIVVSALSGVDQLLSILNAYDINWIWHFGIGVALVSMTYFLTIRGRGESAKVTFMMLAVFAMLSVVMAVGLGLANRNGVPPVPAQEVVQSVSLSQALLHMLTASMKGMVALSGLEAMSNGIQFVIDEDVPLVKWGKEHMPKLDGLWRFYSGKSGIGRFVQTSFLFYGGVTTMFLVHYAIRFNVYDGTLGRTLVGNLSYIAFGQIPGGEILFWAYQLLAVLLLASASMTAFQDVQATAWRDVAIGEIPEVVVYRNPNGTFSRSVTAAYVLAIIIMFLVRGHTTSAVPFYGVGVFMPIMVMGLAIRQHILKHSTGRRRSWGAAAALFAAVLSGVVFVGQIVGKWQEGGWVVLISFSVLSIGAHLLLIAPTGNRAPDQIHRIVVTKARVEGTMASIVEWQSLRMQEYRYQILSRVARFFDIFGVHSPIPSTIPMAPGDYDTAVFHEHPDDPSMLSRRLNHVQSTPPEESAAQETYQDEDSGQIEPEVNKISQDNPEVEPTGQDVAGLNSSGEDTPAVDNNGNSTELNGTEDDSEK